MLLSKKISFCGIFAALSLLFLYITAVSPSGKLALIAAASYCIGLCVVWCGIKLGILAYVAVSVLSFVLVPNIMVAILFAAFFGCYPVIKVFIEKLKKLWLEWILKLAFFNMYFLITPITMYFNMAVGLVIVALNIAFIIYDIMFNYVVTQIVKRGRRL